METAKFKKIKLICVLTLVLSMLVPHIVDAKSYTLGNTSGNIFNGGVAALSGDWIYYRNDAMLGNLYRIKTDGTKKKQLNEDDVSYINIVGDWIYYLNKELSPVFYDMRNYIYKIRLDGTGRKKLCDDAIDNMQVQGDWIYYVHYTNLYKMKTDGSKVTDLKVKCDGVFVEGEWIVYYDLEGYIYKMKTDGTHKAKLGTCGYSVNFLNKLVYYDDYKPGINPFTFEYYPVTFKKVSVDNSIKDTHINSSDKDSGFAINIVGKWIYYINASQDGNIYKIKTDGTKKTLVYSCSADATFHGICIVDDWIYYFNTDDLQQYRVKTDGKNNELVEP